MHVLASDDWCNGVGLLGTCFSAGILELRTFFFKASFDGVGVTVVDLTMFDTGHSVGMLFRQDLAILDWLD